MSQSEFFGRSAATRCFSVRAGPRPRCFSCGQGRAAPLLLFVRAVQLFLSFRGNRPLAVPGGWTSPPHCELRTILQTDLFRYRFFRANGFYTLEPHKLIFYRTFAAQSFIRHLCIRKAGTFLSIHFSIFFSRNDVSGQCLRGAEGESSPQSPPAGAFLQKITLMLPSQKKKLGYYLFLKVLFWCKG